MSGQRSGTLGRLRAVLATATSGAMARHFDENVGSKL